MRQSNPPSAGRVLLIGGNAGAGKTILGQALSRLLEHSLVPVDDIRLVLQEMTSLAEQPGIHYFLAHPTIWQKPPEAVCEGLIAVGNALTRPLSVMIARHLVEERAGPIILEGEDILPALAAQRSFAHTNLAPVSVTDEVRAVFLIESAEDALLNAMRRREPGFAQLRLREQETLVRAHWLYGQWLRRQAEQYGLPALEARPWETLAERVLRALEY